MNRCNFYNTIVNDGVQELDFLDGNLSEFIMQYAPSYYQVAQNDLLSPDLISYKCYGSSEFWWVIMLVNNLDNPFTSLVEGLILEIPNKLDIYEWQRKYQKRASS